MINIFAGAGVMAALALALSACGGTQASTASSLARGGTLTIGSAFEPTTLDPGGAGEPGSRNIGFQIFDQLIETNPGPAGVKVGIKPGLAQSWQLSADGLTYTFHLRAARFSNGDPVTGDDVAFTLNRDIDAKAAPSVAPFLTFVKTVTSPNSSTVIMQLKRPTPAALDYLSLVGTSIIPKQYFEKVGAKGFAEHPIGSGPFELQSWQRGQQIVLLRNPYYWRHGLPYLNKVVVRFITDDNARALALQSGSIDVDDSVPYSRLSSLASQQGVRVQAQPVAATFGVIFDQIGKAIPALRDQQVRQALNYATPKAAIIRVALGNDGRIANSVMPPLEHWSPSVPSYPYDVAKAKQLLATSKWSGGFALKLEAITGNQPALQTATILQQAWGNLGVKVSVVQGTLATMASDISSGNTDAQIWNPTQWASDIGAEDEWGALFTNVFPTYFGYKDARVNRIIDQAMSTLSQSRRAALWTTVQTLTMQDAPWVPIAYPDLTLAMRTAVHGFGYLPTVSWRPLTTAWVAQ